MEADTSASSPEATARISGRVRSKDGAMLQGAEVTCNQIRTRTLADGSYILKDLRPAEYKVTISLQGFKPTSRSIIIRGGEDVVQDFLLTGATGTARIYGQVLDAESKKIANQMGTVILILPTTNRYRNVDEDGYYEFDNLPAGRYAVSTSISGYEDESAVQPIAEGETKKIDFFCRPRRTEEPPWG